MKDLSDEEYNADGSYAYPPHPRSAAQHIDFWMSVPLPEEKLEALSARYLEVRDKLGARAGAEAAWAYEDANPIPSGYESSSDPKRRAQWEAHSARKGVIFDRAVEKRVGHMPERIYRTGARPILRAHQMWVYRLPLPEDERKIVEDYEMQVDGDTLTVDQIIKRYDLTRITSDIL